MLAALGGGATGGVLRRDVGFRQAPQHRARTDRAQRDQL